jgi:hypothetical protein
MSEIKKLWHFRQNNSGGRYTGPAYNLIVEADSEAEAWDEAQKLGATNEDSCPCCGDRWNDASEIESRDHIIYLDTAMEDRTYTCGNFPLVYGCPEWRRGEFRVSMEFENFAK